MDFECNKQGVKMKKEIKNKVLELNKDFLDKLWKKPVISNVGEGLVDY